MRDFPSCFGENGVQVADSSSSSSAAKASQNFVTCVYQCRLHRRLCLITVTWTKNLMGQGLSIVIDDSTNHCLCKVDIKPWLFTKRKGSKNLEVDCGKIDICWDLSNARFGAGPEPIEGYFLAVAFEQEMVFLLGDLKKEAIKKVYAGGARLDSDTAAGRTHDVTIECDTVDLKDPCLVIRIDSKTVMNVKRLKWKFRGNHTILVDGEAVEVFWDVHNWLFGNATGNAVFMFQTCLSADKLCGNQPGFDPSVFTLSYSQKFRDHQAQSLGFSLILYAWKHE
ncbi:NAC domain-containing protein 68-like [Hibiscus syriacus]|uniref:NAC domain-containing protein 68-like n=1 Tax=Hibiscus syriacus TaxID=106335 RepID=A0A6A2Y020_HIBSY|nr:NAC domain-containing protein 68-like [Hibiscus syriacus]